MTIVTGMDYVMLVLSRVMLLGVIWFVFYIRDYYQNKRDKRLEKFIKKDAAKIVDDYTDHLIAKTTEGMSKWYHDMMKKDSEGED